MGNTSNVHYRIRPVHPEAHLFQITLTVTAPDPKGQVLSMPAWIPGSYMIRDFAKNIVTIEANCDGNPVTLEKLDKQNWRAAPCSGTLLLDYTVYAWDLSVRTAHLDTTHGYFNGSSVFLRVDGQDEQPCSVDIEAPHGEQYQSWRIATTLPSDNEDYAFGRFHAADYDELIDHPVEMGNFTLLEFEARGIPHAMVLTGHHYADTERLAADLKRICESEIDLFTEAPFDRYLFQTMVVGSGYGGLEHRSSTSLLCSRDDLPHKGEENVSENYRNFLGLCSHEYFHSWNIKRIKPDVFLPYDLSQESYTPLLWAFEGFTSYYDDLTLLRCGLIDEESYLELLGQTITRVIRGSGRLKQSVTDSSFDAWSKFYKQDENSPNAIVSYYAKGSLIALALDLSIRTNSNGERSLDDVMRVLWRDYGKPHVGISQQQMETLIREIAGEEIAPLLENALYGTDDLPLEALLANFGVELKLRQASGNGDKGGKPAQNGDNELFVLGARVGGGSHGAKLLSVFDDSAAQQAGLSAGDIIVAVDGLRTRNDNIEKLLNLPRDKTHVEVHAFRRDELMHFELPLQVAPLDTCYLLLDEEGSEVIKQLRQSWLHD